MAKQEYMSEMLAVAMRVQLKSNVLNLLGKLGHSKYLDVVSLEV